MAAGPVVFRTWPALEAACARVCARALVLVPGGWGGGSPLVLHRGQDVFLAFSFCFFVVLLAAATRFRPEQCHACRVSRSKNAPWDTIAHLLWLRCEPACCLIGAARGPDSSGRWAFGIDADCVRFSAADGFFYDAHVDMRREAQRQTCLRRRSKLQVPARARTCACRFGVTTTAVSTRGT